MLHRNATLLAAALVSSVTIVQSQTPPAQTDAMPKVGEMAPDFTLKGSTKDGLLPNPIHLADFRGRTVVLAFFPKARTKG
jgi:peroxiredoxin Q/BCP